MLFFFYCNVNKCNLIYIQQNGNVNGAGVLSKGEIEINPNM